MKTASGALITLALFLSLKPSPVCAQTLPDGWLRGQLHAHSSGSGDSNTSPQDVLTWYEEHGFDFVVFTDHNVVTSPPSSEGILAVPG
ncbi:MAG: PHP domain-containing protein, partial [Myxococcales bacterium]|nr:PHP domain-containing protein [Myxococcales bacterium]